MDTETLRSFQSTKTDSYFLIRLKELYITWVSLHRRTSKAASYYFSILKDLGERTNKIPARTFIPVQRTTSQLVITLNTLYSEFKDSHFSYMQNIVLPMCKSNDKTDFKSCN
ncbi:hypothetical protein CIPAW_04G120400 [Carya illinoinensis]|uniref:Uncharacterized protein n=1 Tax=Carya illinoinensis TaxID=32201 RepID=A0A8T1QTM4_CARIL|nr:hypothetical protein CIPAW_04G120400 [Carya illinoinensis]